MFAVQPAAWSNFDEHGCDYAISISHAYRLCGIWQERGEAQGDMMVWRLTSGHPIPWVRVYEDESIDSVTPDALALLAV
tara:strand:- start:405 stop:641 length:237 start_codon:yes stop_codon:yes gene_type:complete